jgi:hypothetical protein
MTTLTNNSHAIESSRAFCRRFCVTVLTVAVVCPGTLLALPNVPEQQGWSGFLGFGAGYTDIKSNTVAGNRLVDGGKNTISDINQSPESSDDFHPAANGEVAYTFGNRNQIFFGTSLEDAVTFDGAMQLGWRKQADRPGIFQVGVLVTSAVPAEVWEDPYQTGTARSDTDRDGPGLRFQWDRIFGTQLEWTLTYRDIDIDTERSGQNVPGCTATCQALLDRNADFFGTRLAWQFNLGKGHILTPLVGYRNMDAEGDAVSYDDTYLQLTYGYLGGDKFTVVVNALIGGQDFDEANPLYGIKQDSDIVLLNATLFYKLSFDSQRWQMFSTIQWAESDSDINFHDNELFQIVIGAMYRFGNQPMTRKSTASR